MVWVWYHIGILCVFTSNINTTRKWALSIDLLCLYAMENMSNGIGPSCAIRRRRVELPGWRELAPTSSGGGKAAASWRSAGRHLSSSWRSTRLLELALPAAGRARRLRTIRGGQTPAFESSLSCNASSCQPGEKVASQNGRWKRQEREHLQERIYFREKWGGQRKKLVKNRLFFELRLSERRWLWKWEHKRKCSKPGLNDSDAANNAQASHWRNFETRSRLRQRRWGNKVQPMRQNVCQEFQSQNPHQKISQGPWEHLQM